MGALFGFLLLSPMVDKFLAKKIAGKESKQSIEQIEKEDDSRN